MNYLDAIKQLNLNHTFTQKELKLSYYKLALKYHPDKNRAKDAEENFKKICEAYDYLLCHKKDYCSDKSYISLITHLLRSTCPNIDITNETIESTINTIFNSCKKALIKIFNNIDKTTAIKFYIFITTNNEILNIEQSTLKELHKIINSKDEINQTCILHPSIDEILNDSVFKLNILDKIFYVPLWHSEIIYDLSGKDIVVYSIPELPKNTSIDNNNNMHINIEESIVSILKNKKVSIQLGEIILDIPSTDIKIINYQIYTLYNKGLLATNHENIFDSEKRMDIIIHLTLY